MRTTRFGRILSVSAVFMLIAAVGVAFPPAPPNDPLYPMSAGPCPGDPNCVNPTGQWNLFGPSTPAVFPATPHASGISVEDAWNTTIGRPDVVVTILDSGVNYDHEDLRNQIWLNRGELPIPNGGACAAPAGDLWDCNNDGVFNVQDYLGDTRILDTRIPGYLSPSDLHEVFKDSVDDDGNGFVDDLTGWDADDDDSDEYDHRRFGHGTGRNGFIAAQTDNADGLAGICPDCRLTNIRVDDTFVHKTEGAAKGAIWAADHGHEVIVMALGATTASSVNRAAFEYARRNNVLAVSASANEFSFHHNFQTVFDDVMAIGAVVPDTDFVQGFPSTPTTTFLRKANFSNYGAHLDVVTPSTAPTTSQGGLGTDGNGAYGDSSGTSSAVPHAGGVAALIYSRARELIDAGTLVVGPLALKDISAQEVRQILNMTADDIDVADDPSGPYVAHLAPGWDRYTGYGRVNADSAVLSIGAGTIPPEADINSPDWYTHVDGVVSVGYYANARWASTFDVVLEVGQGIQPASWTTLSSTLSNGSNPLLSSADMVDTFSTNWDTSALAEGLWTLRLRVTDNLGNVAEDRMSIFVQPPDPDSHPGFPQFHPASIESISLALADLDNDNNLEIIGANSDGEVFAIRENGVMMPGFPVMVDTAPGFPYADSPAFDGDPSNGEVPVKGSSVVGGVAVADIDNDGITEICTAAYDGKVYCWKADGSVQPGFPVSGDIHQACDPFASPACSSQVATSRADPFLAIPAFGDFDGDKTLELVIGSFDQKMYVFNSDGTRRAPWPLDIVDTASGGTVSTRRPAAIISVPVVADIDNDGEIEIVFGTNEVYGTPNVAGQGGSGRAYAYQIDGSLEPGWPVPFPSISPDAVPLVAEGHGTSMAAADIDNDGTLEIAGGVLLSDPIIYNHDGTEFATMQGAQGGSGSGGDGDEETAEGGLGKSSDSPVHFYVAHGAFADMQNTGSPNYMVGTVGNGIASIALSAGAPAPFDHYFSIYDATSGAHLPAFPRVVEDWQFFTGPSIADVDGAVDGLPEAIISSGGWFVHAMNSLGLEAAGWPKRTGHWVVTTPAVGDIDNDGALEVVVTTRLGGIFVWDQPGDACAATNDQWRKFHGDEWNTGVAGNDVRSPARILDLAVVENAADVDLSWTAPGDDASCGTATTYEIVTSGSPINAGNFAAGTPVAAPVPLAAGGAESITFTPPAGHVYFAVRAVDEADNAGAISSVALTGVLDLRKLKLKVRGGGRDRFVLKAQTTGSVLDLGLPGTDVVLMFDDPDSAVYAATVPGGQFVANSKGTRVRFRDSTGAVANGITRAILKFSKNKGLTKIVLKGRDLSFDDAESGPLTVTLSIGTNLLVDTETLISKGSTSLQFKAP